MLGYELVGRGPHKLLVTHDWLCDTSSWDPARAYLDTEQFTYAFADLRGYGRSRALAGRFTIPEAGADLVALADALGWARFTLAGHSMSTLIAVHVAQHHGDRLERLVLITPGPPRGFPPDAERLAQTRALALGDDAARAPYFAQRFTQHLSPGWAAFKAARWRATAEPHAAADYVYTFGRDGVPESDRRFDVPTLALFGARDAPPLLRAAVEPALAALCDKLTAEELADCGHYPMQEAPPLTVARIERFVA